MWLPHLTSESNNKFVSCGAAENNPSPLQFAMLGAHMKVTYNISTIDNKFGSCGVVRRRINPIPTHLQLPTRGEDVVYLGGANTPPPKKIKNQL